MRRFRATRRSRGWATQVLGLLTAAYLSMILAPCAFAVPIAPHHDSGHKFACPDAANGGDCEPDGDEHCPPDPDAAADSKSGSFAMDGGVDQSVLNSDAWLASAASGRCVRAALTASLAHPTDLPARIRYCVLRN